MTADPSALRRSYERGALAETDLDADPFRQFDAWFDEAVEDRLYEPNAMALATVDRDGRPSSRVVLLKGRDPRGFVFFTNYDSRKAGELAGNPHASLLFYWDKLHRQVRIEGEIASVSAEESDAYFDSRPYGSRIGAWASPQSRVVAGRAALEGLEAEYRARFPEAGPVPRPPHWGGLRVVPATIEFWQGRRDRLHDRLRYTRDGSGWRIERLAP